MLLTTDYQTFLIIIVSAMALDGLIGTRGSSRTPFGSWDGLSKPLKPLSQG
jgi:hypothetical protein